MADSFIQVPVDSTGKLVDCEQLTVGANTVQRERHQLTGASAAEIAVIANANPGGGEYALVTRNIPSGTQPVSGTVTANAGSNLNTSLLALEAGGNLASIKAKTDNIPAQGQALAAGSLPVVLTAAQVTTLTPPAAMTNFANETGGNLAAIKTDVDKIPSQGQALMAASMPVVIASNQTSIPVSASFGTATSGGYTIKHLVSAGSTNATNVKASAGQVYGWSIFNVAAYPVYVKFHNTSGTPTAGSGVVQTVAVQAGVSVNVFNVHGIAFGTGIGITIVKDLADAGTTAVLAADCVVDIFYA